MASHAALITRTNRARFSPARAAALSAPRSLGEIPNCRSRRLFTCAKGGFSVAAEKEKPQLMLHGYSESTQPPSVGSSHGRLLRPPRRPNTPNNVDGIAPNNSESDKRRRQRHGRTLAERDVRSQGFLARNAVGHPAGSGAVEIARCSAYASIVRARRRHDAIAGFRRLDRGNRLSHQSHQSHQRLVEGPILGRQVWLRHKLSYWAPPFFAGGGGSGAGGWPPRPRPPLRGGG